MKFCTECLQVNSHHPNCPEADDYEDNEFCMFNDEDQDLSSERERPEAPNNC